MSAQDPSLRETNGAAVSKFVSTHKDTYSFIDPTKADLRGKSVLITGASRGIGKATAISFASAGCSKILLAARSDLADTELAVKEAATKANRPQPLVQSLKVDVTSEVSVQAAAETAADVLGGSLDILINNAGYLAEYIPLGETKPSEWWRTWEVNIKGVYLAVHYFMPLLLKSEIKTILNISSAGSQMMFPGASSYQTTKFALCRLTEFIDKEYYQQGLITMSVNPGAIPTDLAMNLPSHTHHLLTDTLEMAADTLVWLSHPRRDWLSGRYVSVTWDMEELEQKKQDILQGNLLKFRLTI